MSKLLSSKEAAKYLGISESALRQGRIRGVSKNKFLSPPYIKLGPRIVKYEVDVLDKFIKQHLVEPKSRRK